jgi:hypothetical protein
MNLAVAEVVALTVAVALSCSCSIGFCTPSLLQETVATMLLSPPLLVLDAGKRKILKLFFIFYLL